MCANLCAPASILLSKEILPRAFMPRESSMALILIEYPVEGGVTQGLPEDTRNFTAMVAEFRRQLDAVRPGLLLTAALPAEAELYKNFELKKISRTMNELSIMARSEERRVGKECRCRSRVNG